MFRAAVINFKIIIIIIFDNSSTALNAAVTIALLGFIWYWIYGKGTRGGTKQGGILGSNPFVSFYLSKSSVSICQFFLFLVHRFLLCTCLHLMVNIYLAFTIC